MIEIGGRRNARILAGAASCLLSAALSVVVAYGQVPPQRLAPEGASPPIAVTPPVAPPTAAPEQQSPATPSEQKPGWFDTLGHWFDESVTNVNKGWDNVNKGLKSPLGAVGGKGHAGEDLDVKSATVGAHPVCPGGVAKDTEPARKIDETYHEIGCVIVRGFQLEVAAAEAESERLALIDEFECVAEAVRD